MAITLITGAIKSGKSEFAEKKAHVYKKLTYIALSEKQPNDINWQEKIRLHKSRRPSSWQIIESDDLLCVFKKVSGPLLIDSIGGFVVKNINEDNNEWKRNLLQLKQCLIEYKSDIIIVGEQVGWGLVSEYEIGNIYTERIGEVLRHITLLSNDNWLTINGKAIKLDNIFCDI
tara:strand:+ start:151 stop:669 length:519 start_codon:yes stop_codon:yes gene_type:complete